jgi:hypothetical protein
MYVCVYIKHSFLIFLILCWSDIIQAYFYISQMPGFVCLIQFMLESVTMRMAACYMFIYIVITQYSSIFFKILKCRVLKHLVIKY